MFVSQKPVLSANVLFLLALTWGTAAHAELVIAPVFNRVEGSGPTEDFNLGLTTHTPLNAPGDQFAYVSGDPRDPAVDAVHFWNDSSYDITGFSLRIVGTGTDTKDPTTIILDENVDARFGDVEGYPISSDIFSNIEITENGKAIRFSGGLIPPGGRFTDVHYADSDLVPEIQAFDYAAIDSSFDGVPADPRLCLVQNDPVAAEPFNLVNAFCVPPTDPIGDPGETANIRGSGEFAANDEGQLDVFVIWEPLEVGVSDGQSFTYSSSLSWSSDKPDARVKEWVGNFNPGPDTPFAVMITDSGDPALTPAELSITATSASITDRTFDSSQFPPPIGRYHIQVTGLDPGELVTFSKSAAGGLVVVPEPSSMLLGMLGFLSLLMFRKQRSFTKWVSFGGGGSGYSKVRILIVFATLTGMISASARAEEILYDTFADNTRAEWVVRHPFGSTQYDVEFLPGSLRIDSGNPAMTMLELVSIDGSTVNGILRSTGCL